jgi:hypothetical protein
MCFVKLYTFFAMSFIDFPQDGIDDGQKTWGSPIKTPYTSEHGATLPRIWLQTLVTDPGQKSQMQC